MPNNISQEAALVGHIAEKGAPGKDGKTPVKGVDYWTSEDKTNIIHDVLESDEYQSVKGLVGTKENPVNFMLLEPGAYVFQGYMSITISGETVTNQAPCPKELLLVREVLFATNTGLEDELTYEIYMKFGYLFHTDFDGSIFGDSSTAGAGVFGIGVLPSSVKFLGEWPEDKKNEVITKMETSSTGFAEWLDEWMADDTDYVTHDELSNAIANLATEQYVNNAIANLATKEDVNNATIGMATDQYVDDAIQQVSSVVEQINSVIGTLATTEYVDAAISNITFPPSLTEDQVNSLIDAKLGVIENGHY